MAGGWGSCPGKQTRSLRAFPRTQAPPRPRATGPRDPAPGPGWGRALRGAPRRLGAPNSPAARPAPPQGADGRSLPAEALSRPVRLTAGGSGSQPRAGAAVRRRRRRRDPGPRRRVIIPPRASRPGPRPPPPGAVPAPVPRGEPPQPPARSAARPLAAAAANTAAAASAPRAPASASCCRPGPPPGPSLRSRRCRQTRQAERRAPAPIRRPRPAGTIHQPRAMTPTEAEVRRSGPTRTT